MRRDASFDDRDACATSIRRMYRSSGSERSRPPCELMTSNPRSAMSINFLRSRGWRNRRSPCQTAIPWNSPRPARSNSRSKPGRTSRFHADRPSSSRRPGLPSWRWIVVALSSCWVSILSSLRVDGFQDSQAYESKTA